MKVLFVVLIFLNAIQPFSTWSIRMQDELIKGRRNQSRRDIWNCTAWLLRRAQARARTHTQTGWFDYQPSYWRCRTLRVLEWTEPAGFPDICQTRVEVRQRSVDDGVSSVKPLLQSFLWHVCCLIICFWKTLDWLLGTREGCSGRSQTRTEESKEAMKTDDWVRVNSNGSNQLICLGWSPEPSVWSVFRLRSTRDFSL